MDLQELSDKEYNKILDSCRDSAIENSKICNENTHNLSSILVTISTAMLTIVTVSLGNTDSLNNLSFQQRTTIILSIVLIFASLILGLLAIVRATTKAHDLSSDCIKIEKQLADQSDSTLLPQHRKAIDDINSRAQNNYGFKLIIAQIITFIIGALFIVIYIAFTLFQQSNVSVETQPCQNIVIQI